MSGNTLDIRDIISPDTLAVNIANKWIEWNNLRDDKLQAWEEVRRYVYATDTTYTTNAKLPWKNKTTVPKLTQIRDNLLSNYHMASFPKKNWLDWRANTKDADSLEKRSAILSYMNWVVSQVPFKEEMTKLILDYIDYGNCFATVEWTDQRVELEDKTQVGYLGPSVRRISPLDIVFNPIAASFIDTPKIIRSFMTIGELKKKLDQMSIDENRDEYKQLFDYLIDLRQKATISDRLEVQDAYLQMDGFDSFRHYLGSDYVEILTFYGDLYDYEAQELLENHVIMVVDKHKLISKKPNPSFFGYPPIFNCSWRPRQDNLWGMGPLDNLVGLQYRIDHLENLKADAFDLIAFPVLKIKGHVEDFDWGPGQRIYINSNEDDVEMLAPPYQVLQIDSEIEVYANTMETMAGAPKEAMGFRTPGEKTAYEVTRLENAAARIFQNKINQFDDFKEQVLNAQLELARRNMSGVQEIAVFDDEMKLQIFMNLTADDITGAGLLKPVGARHFAEKAEMIQNLSNFYNSAAGQDPMVTMHFSGIKTARMFEDLLELQQFELVQDYVRLGEQQQAQQISASGQEQLEMNIMTPSGLAEDDYDPELA